MKLPVRQTLLNAHYLGLLPEFLKPGDIFALDHQPSKRYELVSIEEKSRSRYAATVVSDGKLKNLLLGTLATVRVYNDDILKYRIVVFPDLTSEKNLKKSAAGDHLS